jgi:hypothetical protein
MKLLRKLPNSVRQPPGLEWTILKKLPLTLLVGTLFPVAISVANRFFPPQGDAAQIAKYVKSVDIMAIATAVTGARGLVFSPFPGGGSSHALQTFPFQAAACVGPRNSLKHGSSE